MAQGFAFGLVLCVCARAKLFNIGLILGHQEEVMMGGSTMKERISNLQLERGVMITFLLEDQDREIPTILTIRMTLVILVKNGEPQEIGT